MSVIFLFSMFIIDEVNNIVQVEPPDKRWQYLLFAAEPYETIGFKIPSREVDKSEHKFWSLFNKETKQVIEWEFFYVAVKHFLFCL